MPANVEAVVVDDCSGETWMGGSEDQNCRFVWQTSYFIIRQLGIHNVLQPIGICEGGIAAYCIIAM